MGWLLVGFCPGKCAIALFLLMSFFILQGSAFYKTQKAARRRKTRISTPRAAAAILSWISGSSPQSTADPSGTDAAAPAFARGGRSPPEAASAMSPQRQGAPLPTDALVPGRAHHFGRPMQPPPTSSLSPHEYHHAGQQHSHPNPYPSPFPFPPSKYPLMPPSNRIPTLAAHSFAPPAFHIQDRHSPPSFNQHRTVKSAENFLILFLQRLFRLSCREGSTSLFSSFRT